jgi:predicted aminopeptidase
MKKSFRLRRLIIIAVSLFIFLFVIICLAIGRSNISYLSQAIKGHFRIMNSRKSIEKILEDSVLDKETRNKLNLVLSVRKFASNELGLPDNKSYTVLSRIKEQYLGWNVYCTPKYSTDPVKWCFPIAGCVVYHGYFSKNDAMSFAVQMMNEGYDVFVGPFNAYSTLGWYNDPLLSSHLKLDSIRLASIIIHELAHQKYYVSGDSRFNEGFAVTVERVGTKRWLKSIGRQDQLLDAEKIWSKEDSLVSKIIGANLKLKTLYEGSYIEKKQHDKDSIFDLLTQVLLKLNSNSYNFPKTNGEKFTLNNAYLVPVCTYYSLLPYFVKSIDSLDDNLPRFYDFVKELGKLKIEERKQKMNY